MFNIILPVILASFITTLIVYYNLNKLYFKMPEQNITIRMNNKLKKQMESLNCSQNERNVLNKYKEWLNNNSTKLKERVHVENYRLLFGQSPFTSVKELIKYSITPTNNYPILPSPTKL